MICQGKIGSVMVTFGGTSPGVRTKPLWDAASTKATATKNAGVVASSREWFSRRHALVVQNPPRVSNQMTARF